PRLRDLVAVLARLAALVGPDNVGSPRLDDSHRPDAYTLTAFAPPDEPGGAGGGRTPRQDPPLSDAHRLVLRRARPARRVAVAAARLEMPAVALCDRDGVYGAPRFTRAALGAGVKPIIGSEITLTDGSRLPLLVEDREGYQNLCHLITRMKLGAAKGSAAVTL